MKHHLRHHFLFLICLYLWSGCNTSGSQHSTADKADSVSGDYVPVQYAQGFTIRRVGRARLVVVTYPYQGATTSHQYLLVQKDEPVPPGAAFQDVPVVRVPVSRVVCTSTSHIPMLDYLGETDKLVGFPTPDYISSPKMRARIDAGQVQDLGVDKDINMELLAVLHPDLVMGYMISGNYGPFKTMEAMNIPAVVNAEYLERDPLGRAEWIKFVAAFFNKEAMADSVFRAIEKEYKTIKTLAAGVKDRPTVLSGILYGDAWFMPGGQNYAARFYNDAGYRYLWRDDPSHGFLQLSFETVYAQAHDADLWIGVGAYESLADLAAAGHQYTQFRAFKEGNVYTYSWRKGASGGNEYMELGYLRPDIVLKDLVKIAHPTLLPSYALYFHKKLE